MTTLPGGNPPPVQLVVTTQQANATSHDRRLSLPE